MSAFFVIVGRELRERKMLFKAAPLLGLWLLIFPYLGVMVQSSATDSRAIWTGGLANLLYLLIAVTAIFAGASLVASDVHQRRFSFYLARPVSLPAIWFGKLATAWTFPVIGALLVATPVTLLGYGLIWMVTEYEGRAGFLYFLLLLVPASISLAHVLGVAMRSRSAWLLLDLVALSVFGFVVWLSLEPFVSTASYETIRFVVTVTVLVMTISLLVAGFLGSARGRTDLRTTHGAQSIAMTLALLPAIAIVLATSQWIRSVDPEDLRTVDLLPCQSWQCSPLITESLGWSGYRAVFAITPGGPVRLERVPSIGDYSFDTVIGASSRDGDVVAWKSAGSRTDTEIEMLPQDEMSPSAPLPVPIWAPLTISADGRRLAYQSGAETLEILDIEDRRTVRVFRLSLPSPDLIAFLSPDQILVARRERPANAEVTLMNVSDGSRSIHRISGFPFGYDADHARLFSREGRTIHAISTEDWGVRFSREASDLAATAAGIVLARPDHSSIELLSVDGDVLKEIRIEPPASKITLGHITGHHLTLSMTPVAGGDRQLLRVDLETGEVMDLGLDLVPARELVPSIAGPWYIHEENGLRALVRLDENGNVKHLTGRNASGRSR